MKRTEKFKGYVSARNTDTDMVFVRPYGADERFFPVNQTMFGNADFRAHFTVSSSGEKRGHASEVLVTLHDGVVRDIKVLVV